MKDIPSILEAFLFSEGGPMRKSRLSQLTGIDAKELEAALDLLETRLKGGLSLVRTETEAALVISAETSDAVRDAQKEEMGDEIGDAGLEVLAIVLYRGPSTRAKVDYIRGVNTASTIRNLLARGLLERSGNPLDGREYIYRPTTELLAFLGVSKAQELPEYATISSELAAFERDTQNQPTPHASTSDNMHDGGTL